jgi:hypothetical protein
MFVRDKNIAKISYLLICICALWLTSQIRLKSTNNRWTARYHKILLNWHCLDSFYNLFLIFNSFLMICRLNVNTKGDATKNVLAQESTKLTKISDCVNTLLVNSVKKSHNYPSLRGWKCPEFQAWIQPEFGFRIRILLDSIYDIKVFLENSENKTQRVRLQTILLMNNF